MRGERVSTSPPEMFYVAGNTAKSVAAFTNPTRICQEHFEDKYQITIIFVDIFN